MKDLGIITGLVREADCLSGPLVRCSGPGPERALETARALIGEGCGALISFGIAGGLDPALKAGDLVLAETVISADGKTFTTDEEWRGRLLAVLGDLPSVGAPLIGAARVIMTAEGKRRLFEDTGAVAVDMESHAIAEVCAQAGIPFLVVRAVSDPADGEIPRSALKGVGRDGRDQILPVVRSLLKRPWELPGLLRLKSGSDRALEILRRVAVLAGPRFGLD